jgi:hypothetical protein
MSARTLQRRLANVDITFQQLVEENSKAPRQRSVFKAPVIPNTSRN